MNRKDVKIAADLIMAIEILPEVRKEVFKSDAMLVVTVDEEDSHYEKGFTIPVFIGAKVLDFIEAEIRKELEKLGIE
jgi:hypothetical protein